MLIITVNTLLSILGIVYAGNFSSSILNFIKIFRRLTTFAHDYDIYFFLLIMLLLEVIAVNVCQKVT